MTLSDLPTLNASLNFLAACFLIAGRFHIAKGDVARHKKCMLTAFGFSTAFLASYLAYHFLHGVMTPYTGTGILRGIYFFILATHVPLAALQTPLVLRVLWLAWSGNTVAHKRLARWVWPVWLYVSVTGVLIYFMLRWT